jgi:hypothetical protein
MFHLRDQLTVFIKEKSFRMESVTQYIAEENGKIPALQLSLALTFLAAL